MNHCVKSLLELGFAGVVVKESDDVLIDDKGDTAGWGDSQQAWTNSFVERKPAFISGQRNKPVTLL